MKTRPRENGFVHLLLLLIALVVALAGAPLLAQSPNTATIMSTSSIRPARPEDARVSVINNATGAARDAVTGSDGMPPSPRCADGHLHRQRVEGRLRQ